MVALIGYSVSFDKTTFGCYVARAICSIPLRSGKTIIACRVTRKYRQAKPHDDTNLDENGQLLWAQRDVPWLMKMISPTG